MHCVSQHTMMTTFLKGANFKAQQPHKIVSMNKTRHLDYKHMACIFTAAVVSADAACKQTGMQMRAGSANTFTLSCRWSIKAIGPQAVCVQDKKRKVYCFRQSQQGPPEAAAQSNSVCACERQSMYLLKVVLEPLLKLTH